MSRTVKAIIITFAVVLLVIALFLIVGQGAFIFG